MHFIATFVDWTRNHILSPNFREKHQSSWGRISQDRFLPSWKFHELYIVSGKTFLSGILNSLWGLYRGKLFVLSFSMAMKPLTPRWWSTKSCLRVGDRRRSPDLGKPRNTNSSNLTSFKEQFGKKAWHPRQETIIVGDFRLGGYQEVINWVGVALARNSHRICFVLQVRVELLVDLSVHPVQGDKPSQQPSGLLLL